MKESRWPKDVERTLSYLHAIQRDLKRTFVQRDACVDLMALAVVCRENLLLLGPPGTAKTQIIRRFTERIAAEGFYYLLTRFTEPSELFGPLDLEKFRAGTYQVRTDGMLPKADVAFLDEVFEGSSAILNALLTLVNERVFYNGPKAEPVPLISLIGASNALPEDPALRAFADRFALRLELERVPDESLEDLVGQGWHIETEAASRRGAGGGGDRAAVLDRERIVAICDRTSEVDVGKVQNEYVAVVRDLRAEGVELSDRRVVKGLKLVAGAALLRGADVAEPRDLWPLRHIWTRPEEATTCREIIDDHLGSSGGATEPGRTPDDIRKDLLILRHQQSTLNTEASVGAHLMALNRLRREVFKDHGRDGGLLGEVDAVIGLTMERLEQARV